ncbi:MAG: PQQ-binding-like beta-propeller repeat protein [Planctomycetota bacterium]|nr:PQQ-binding-like beta-propeller repeat protein [Planctomycetota bacterium]
MHHGGATIIVGVRHARVGGPGRPRRWAGLAIGAILLVPCPSVPAGDWPQWGRTAGRNMACPETNLPADVTAAPLDWAVNLGTGTYGTPALANGKIVIGTNDSCLHDDRLKVDGGGLVMCLNAADGSVLWQLPIPPLRVPNISHFDGMFLGICSPPTIDGDRVYLVSNRGEVLCLDLGGQANGNDGPFLTEGQYMARKGQAPWDIRPGDGDILWRYDMVAQVPCYPHDAACSAVLIHGDLAYVGTSNGVDHTHVNVPCPYTASLIALDKKTGRLVARDDERIGTRIFDGQWSSPTLGTVAGKTLVFYGGGDGICYAFEALEACPPGQNVATLKKAWATDCNPPEYRVRDGKV